MIYLSTILKLVINFNKTKMPEYFLKSKIDTESGVVQCVLNTMKQNWGDLILELGKNTALYKYLEKTPKINLPEGLQRKINKRYVEEGYYFDNDQLIGMCKL